MVNDAHAEEIQKLQKIDTCMAQADAKDKEVKDSACMSSPRKNLNSWRGKPRAEGLTTMLDDILKHQLHPLLERRASDFASSPRASLIETISGGWG